MRSTIIAIILPAFFAQKAHVRSVGNSLRQSPKTPFARVATFDKIAQGPNLKIGMPPPFTGLRRQRMTESTNVRATPPDRMALSRAAAGAQASRRDMTAALGAAFVAPFLLPNGARAEENATAPVKKKAKKPKVDDTFYQPTTTPKPFIRTADNEFFPGVVAIFGITFFLAVPYYFVVAQSALKNRDLVEKITPAESRTYAICTASVLLGLVVGGGVTVAMFRRRRSASDSKGTASQALLD